MCARVIFGGAKNASWMDFIVAQIEFKKMWKNKVNIEISHDE